VILRILTLAAAALAAGCASAPPAGAPTAVPEPAAAADDASSPFPELAPIMHARVDGAWAGTTPAVETVRSAEAPPPVKVEPLDASAPSAPLASREMQSLEKRLADVTRKLKAFNESKSRDLDGRARLDLMAATREAMLLLLLTRKIEGGDACPIVLETLENLKKLQVSNLELAGLQFVLYQHLSDERRRDDVLECLVHDHEARESFRLEEVVFCESVAGRDKYVPVARAEFKSGARLKIYCGFRGAKAGKLPDGGNGQRLQAFLSILDDADKRVQIVEFLDEKAGTRALKGGEAAGTPGYIYGTYELPKNLRSGEYRLELSVKDLVAGVPESKAAAKFTVRE
jgi:hypothetical protein